MSEARIGRISNENSTAGPIISGITTFSGQNYFVPPKGTTAERPSNCPVGSIRFNTDSAKLEYFDGLQWLEMEAFNNELGVSGALGNRGIFAGAYNPNRSAVVEYITISTLGNSISFGTLTANTGGCSGTNDATRGWILGGNEGTYVNRMQYVTIASTGTVTNSSTLSTTTGTHPGSVSSSTRGILAGGLNPTYLSTIQYHTIQTTGSSVTFGNLSAARYGIGGVMSSTRGIFCGGGQPSVRVNTLEYITMSTLGNVVDFGDLSLRVKSSMGGCSNSTRGILAGGRVDAAPTSVNDIEYVTIASLGNAQDFGDLTVCFGDVGAVSSSTRAVISGGTSSGSYTGNGIEYVTIASTGNGTDFGDLTQNNVASQEPACISNGHGGL